MDSSNHSCSSRSSLTKRNGPVERNLNNAKSIATKTSQLPPHASNNNENTANNASSSSPNSNNSLYVASIVATYWFISISMVYLNKVLMSSKEISIDAPIFVTWFQCIITSLICYAVGMIGEQTRISKVVGDSNINKSSTASSVTTKSFFAQFPKVTFEFNTAIRILPLSLVFVGMIMLNNLCLKWVEVSFYNVARSLTIVFNVIFSRLLLGIPTSFMTTSALMIVIFGFCMGSSGELNFSWTGTTFGVLSSLFVSLNSIYTKKVLVVVNDNHWKLTFYNNMNASILFIPIIVLFTNEVSVLVSQLPTKSFIYFWIPMIITGIFGFSMGIISVLQIKATSPLSHNISGTAKAAFQSFLAFKIWNNQATVMGIMGICVTLGGSLLYTFVKMSENNNSNNKTSGKQTQQDQQKQSLLSSSSSQSSFSENDIEKNIEKDNQDEYYDNENSNDDDVTNEQERQQELITTSSLPASGAVAVLNGDADSSRSPRKLR